MILSDEKHAEKLDFYFLFSPQNVVSVFPRLTNMTLEGPPVPLHVVFH